jgi:ribosomal protein S18 acetylase RimI-like enzyme
MRVRTVQAGDWREYREIRLAALKDAPSAFASTWQQEAARSPRQWRERAALSHAGLSRTIVVAVDDSGRWIGLAGGYRPGDGGADAELISMWVAPDCRCRGVGYALARAVLSWAADHGGRVIGLWVNAANRPAISLYEQVGFCRTGEIAPLPSDPTQQEVRMLRNG